MLYALEVAVKAPSGKVVINVDTTTFDGKLTEPTPPVDAGFRPPPIFAAPLPVGSGARALGQAGAFTAVADDATAASWNPAGLIQLEWPELSAVYRGSDRTDHHAPKNQDVSTAQNQYANHELNYLSAVYPARLNNRNITFSLNFQEAYDFAFAFTGTFLERNNQTEAFRTNYNYSISYTTNIVQDSQIFDMETTISREVDRWVNQSPESQLLSSIHFLQEGTIDALSPAFAIELNPRLSIGATLNVYLDGSGRGNPIRSTKTAEYEGHSENDSTIHALGDYYIATAWEGVWFGGTFVPVATPFSGESETIIVNGASTNQYTSTHLLQGRYQEENRTENLYGANATLGALWVAHEKLTLGATLELPWTGRGKQTKTIEHEIVTYNSNRVEVARTTHSTQKRRDVEYTFPLYWSIGGLWRWSDRFFSSLDLSRTHWSSFSYKAEGEERINPLTGTPFSSSSPDDCWSARFGSEYLMILRQTEIPLRGGLFWEQRPALGSPDHYWGFSLGSGLSIGKSPARIIFDVAYLYEQGNNVMEALLPDRALHSDVTRHQLFLSAIWHF